MSLEQMQVLAYAAGFAAVVDEDLDIPREAAESRDTRAGEAFIPGWHMPDAPAPRTTLLPSDQSRAVAVVEPLWRQPSSVRASGSWAQHLVSVARGMSAYIPGRGLPA